MAGKREIWVDNVKVVACILVVLGHFFQSMTQSGIMPASDLYRWFNQTIYCFHVPLFFICSGLLYQKLSVVDSPRAWGKSVLKKAINLGVPYFVFSTATWLLKTLFSDSVNSGADSLGATLFINPVPPYWYLYALFFLFLITPTFKSGTAAAIGLAAAAALKLLVIAFGGLDIQALTYIMSNEVWFVIGMCLSVFKCGSRIKSAALPGAIGVLFLALSAAAYLAGVEGGIAAFLLGLLACFAVTGLIFKRYENREQTAAFGFLAKYTMPIFLMHTLFAAPLRAAFLKLGIDNAVIHTAAGLAISFIGPIVTAKLMKITKYPEFLLYPGKFIKIK